MVENMFFSLSSLFFSSYLKKSRNNLLLLPGVCIQHTPKLQGKEIVALPLKMKLILSDKHRNWKRHRAVQKNREEADRLGQDIDISYMWRNPSLRAAMITWDQTVFLINGTHKAFEVIEENGTGSPLPAKIRTGDLLMRKINAFLFYHVGIYCGRYIIEFTGNNLILLNEMRNHSLCLGVIN